MYAILPGISVMKSIRTIINSSKLYQGGIFEVYSYINKATGNIRSMIKSTLIKNILI